MRVLNNAKPGSILHNQEDIPDAWVMVTDIEATEEVYAGTMYMMCVSLPEDCEVQEVGKSHDLMMVEVNKGFKKIAGMVQDSLDAKENILIALAGKCGIGKSTMLPKQILTICHDANVIVVESRRQVCLRNVAYMHSVGGDLGDGRYLDENSVKVCVGTYMIHDEEGVPILPRSYLEQIILGKAAWWDFGMAVCTTGIMEGICTTIEWIPADEVPKLRPKSLVIIFSDWEEKGARYGYCIALAKRMLIKLGLPVIFVMASQSTLVSPWFDFVKEGITRVEQVFIPQTMERDLVDLSLGELRPERYNLICPDRDNFEAIEEWEVALWKLVRVQSVRLLADGGCLLVKVLGRAQCFKLALCFDIWQEEMEAQNQVKLGIKSIPYTGKYWESDSVKKADKAVVWCTDVVTYGHNFPRCRGVISCGLRKVVRYDKTFGVTKLIPVPMSKETTLQLNGRIDRGGRMPGAGFTFIPWDSILCKKRDDLAVERDEGMLLLLLDQSLPKFHTLYELQNMELSNIVGLTTGGDLPYCYLLLNINYALVHGGPKSLWKLKKLMNWVGKKLSLAPVRWRFITHTLLLILCNRHNNLSVQSVINDNFVRFEHYLHRILLYVAFYEGGEDWIIPRVEARWRRHIGLQEYDGESLLEAMEMDKLHKVKPLSGQYGGEGYRSMNFVHKWFSVKTRKKEHGPGTTQTMTCFTQSTGMWMQVVDERTVKRNLNKIGNLISTMKSESFGGPIRGVTRLFAINRWDCLSETEIYQLLLCNTRPLQVARIVWKEEDPQVKVKGALKVAQTIVTKETVCFVDDSLLWRKGDIPLAGYCKCCKLKLKGVRYIYFGGVKGRQVRGNLTGVYEVRDTMAIAHEIGCLLEDWFMKTEMVGVEKKVAVDVTVTTMDNVFLGGGVRTSKGVDVDMLRRAVSNNFEEDSTPAVNFNIVL